MHQGITGHAFLKDPIALGMIAAVKLEIVGDDIPALKPAQFQSGTTCPLPSLLACCIVKPFAFDLQR
jgi:hypothetical protein